MSSPSLSVTSKADYRRLTVIVMLVVFATATADGFDVVVIGAVIPSLLADTALNLNPASVGVLASAAIVGMFVGSLASGWLTDRFGRKRMLILCIVWFTVFTSLCALAPTVEVLGAFRLIAGLALGGVMPTASAIAAEYTPPARRNLVFGVMWAGFPLGGILAALAGLVIIPAFGWRGMFALGLIPLFLIVPFAMALLPESAAFLLSKGERDRAAAIAAKHGFALADAGAIPAETPNVARGSVRSLFRNGLARLTVAFWIASFLCLSIIYALNTWLPAMMQNAGYSLGSALVFLLVYNVGAMVGLVLISYFADKFNSRRVIIAAFLLAAAGVAALSAPMPTVGLYGALIVAGAAALGTQSFINAWVSKASPTEVRATALGWSLGIGRLGSLLAPTALGLLVASGVSAQWSFYAIALPGVIGAVAIFLLTARPLSRSRIESNDVKAVQAEESLTS